MLRGNFDVSTLEPDTGNAGVGSITGNFSEIYLYVIYLFLLLLTEGERLTLKNISEGACKQVERKLSSFRPYHIWKETGRRR